MQTLQISLFGDFAVVLDGKALEGYRTHKVAALLAILASEPEKKHRRESLMTLLWPGLPEASARNNLRQVLYHLRRMIPDFTSEPGEIPLVIATRDTIRLNPTAPVVIDAQVFTELTDRIRTHEHLDLLTCPVCSDLMGEATSLYSNHFLASFFLDDSTEFENWAETIRQNLRRRVLDLLETRTSIALRKGSFGEARSLAERQLELDDLHESANQQLMEALARGGQRNEAITVYERFRRLLQDELGMLPAERTTRVYEQILAGDLQLDTFNARKMRGYDLKEEIGTGSFGLIFRAIQPPIGRDVAVKIFRREFANDPSFIRRFEVEAQTIARLEHPHIVPIYDYWRDPDGAYLVMRLLRGGNLLEALENGAWTLDRTRQLIDQVAPALAVTHAQGVIHCDIKPSNIVFDENGNAFLSDFGIARNLLSDRQGYTSEWIARTLDYISPELLLDEAASPMSDIYSLGAVIYETLTGEKPFPDRSTGSVIRSHMNLPFPLVRDLVPSIPPAVDLVLQQATAKEPADRFPDVSVFAEAFREAARGVRFESASLSGGFSPAVLQNPYKGLRTFQQSDAADFFGRETLTARLLEELAKKRFVALVGPSGSGKSSVIKAGVLPALQEGAIPGSERWFVAEMVPGSHPLDALSQALLPVAVDPPANLVDPLGRDAHSLLRTIRRILPGEEGAQLLLVIDQFEELWSMAAENARRRFLEGLLAALRTPQTPLRVIVTLRADFYDRPLLHQPLANLFKGNTTLCLPLTEEELAWAIREPAARSGVEIEEAVQAALISDARDQPGILPLLEYALTLLFESRVEGRITFESYTTIGGLSAALTGKAEEIYGQLPTGERELVRQLFLRLIILGSTPGQHNPVPDARRRALRSELEDLAPNETAENVPRIEKILDLFGAARLLTFDHDPVSRRPTVEVAHEALLREWRRLIGWLDAGRSDLHQHRSLLAAIAEWESAGREDSYLLHGTRLDQYESWASESSLVLTNRERDFLAASSSARQEKDQAETERQARELETVHRLAETERRRVQEGAEAVRRLRLRALYLTIALLVAGVLAGLSIVFGQRALQNEQIAVAEAAQRATAQAEAEVQALLATSRELAAAALTSMETDPERSILLALQALAAAHTPQAEIVLHASVLESRVRRTLTVGEGLWGVAFSPDGRTIALADESGRLTLWNAITGEVDGTIEGHVGYISDVAFSPDGALIATAGDDNARVWNTQTGAEMFRMENHKDYVLGIVFSPDGRFIATSSQDGTARIWDVVRSLQTGIGQETRLLTGHTGLIWKVGFSPDGTRVATAGEDGTARIWDVTSGKEIRRIEILDESGNPMEVDQVLFSPAGDRLVVIGGTQTAPEISFWDPAKGEFLYRVYGHATVVQNGRFSPDGSRLVTAGADGAAIVWDLGGPSPQEVVKLAGHTGWVNDAVFSPDGKWVVTVSRDGTARLWDVTATGRSEGLAFDGEIGWRGAIDIDPDGRVLAGGDDAGMIRFWDAATGELWAETAAHKGQVLDLAFDPAGGFLATAGEDRLIRFWDPSTGTLLQTLSGHGPVKYDWPFDGVMDLAFSPDGRILASGGADGQVILWDPATGAETIRLSVHPQDRAALSAVFNFDGSLIAAGTDRPGRVTVWDTATGTELIAFPAGETRRVWALAFSPRENLLAFGNNQGRLEVWQLPKAGAGFDPAAAVELYAIDPAHASGVFSIDFSPDGNHLVTTGADQTIRVWEASSGREILMFDYAATAAIYAQAGKEIVSAGADGLVRIYFADLQDLLALAEARLTRRLTLDECKQYLHAEACPGG